MDSRCRGRGRGAEKSVAPALVYHKLMLPSWFGDNATWNADYEINGSRLSIKPDSANWENILNVQLLPEGLLASSDDITVNMVVGAHDPNSTHNGPISCMISDGNFAIGFQLNGEENELTAVEGEPGKILRNVNLAAVAPGSSLETRGEIRASIKPYPAWGKAAGPGGATLVAPYSDSLDLSKGLQLEMYRYKSTDIYTVNYVEITVYKGSPEN